jgi:hypothetical protein
MRDNEMAPGSQPGSPDASGTFVRPKESDLDRDRSASMADEGGTAGAEADLREQLDGGENRFLPQVAPPTAAWSFTRVRWSTLMWSAVAFGAAGFLAALAFRSRGRA